MPNATHSTETLTDTMIRTLRAEAEAGAAGDTITIALCGVALASGLDVDVDVDVDVDDDLSRELEDRGVVVTHVDADYRARVLLAEMITSARAMDDDAEFVVVVP